MQGCFLPRDKRRRDAVLPAFDTALSYFRLRGRRYGRAESWEHVCRCDGFFIEAGESGRMCFAAFDYLEYHKDLIDKRQTEFFKICPSGSNKVMLRYNYAVDFDIPAELYNFDLFAYRCAVPLDESTPENHGRNYAFGFAFRRAESAESDNLTKGDNEKTIFDISRYIESTR